MHETTHYAVEMSIDGFFLEQVDDISDVCTFPMLWTLSTDDECTINHSYEEDLFSISQVSGTLNSSNLIV